MPRNLYAVTAVLNGLPVGAFVIAANPDECTARASKRLGDRGRITHLIPLCEATPGTMKRNGLLRYCDKGEAIEFLADTLLVIIRTLQSFVETLKQSLQIHTQTLVEHLKLERFRFSVTKDGVTEVHETFAPDFGAAFRAATKLCQEEYGKNPDFVARVSDETE